MTGCCSKRAAESSAMGCDTLRCSCRNAGLDCSTGCGECRGICSNMYEYVTEDNEYDEETGVVILLKHYLVYRIDRNNQMVK